MHFANPWAFLALILVPLLVWRYLRRVRSGEGSLQFASTLALEGVRPPWTVKMRHLLFGFRMARPVKKMLFEATWLSFCDFATAETRGRAAAKVPLIASANVTLPERRTSFEVTRRYPCVSPEGAEPRKKSAPDA